MTATKTRKTRTATSDPAKQCVLCPHCGAPLAVRRVTFSHCYLFANGHHGKEFECDEPDGGGGDCLGVYCPECEEFVLHQGGYTLEPDDVAEQIAAGRLKAGAPSPEAERQD